jgi:hypothetical protein
MSLFDDASVVITPNGQKAGKLYSIKPTDGSGDLSVTRATSATRVDANGLVEIPITNLVLRSEEFDNAIIWPGSVGVVRLANQGIAPNGTNTMDLITFPIAGNSLSQSVTVISGTTYTFSIWLATQSGTQTVEIGNINSGVYQSVTVTTTAQRFEITQVASSTNRFPAIRATATYSILVWGAQLEQGVTATEYIPTTSVIRTKFAGITQDGSSASNIPRLDYTNSSCPSILVEPQRTNLVLRSEEFNISPWSTLGTTTITANATTSPSGNLTADLILGADSTSNVNQIISGTTGVVYTNSFYIKNNNSTQSRLTIRNTITAVECNINWTGSLLSSITNLTGTTTFQSVGNGWYRIISTYTAVESPQRPRIIPTLNTNQSVYVWGAQLEAGSNATSYIFTTSASVTRNADVISKTGISSLIGQTEGTIFIETQPLQSLISDGVARSLFSLNENSLSLNLFYLRRINNNYILNVNSSGVTLATPTIFTYSNINLNKLKIAIKYGSNTLKVFVNGINTVNQTISSIPSTNTLTLGSNRLNGDILDGRIDLFQLYKTQLTDAECIQLTTL